ncbi:hypothetical protein V1522DRAFT_410729 [Lipomyces starkeyi]
MSSDMLILTKFVAYVKGKFFSCLLIILLLLVWFKASICRGSHGGFHLRCNREVHWTNRSVNCSALNLSRLSVWRRCIWAAQQRYKIMMQTFH